PPTTYSPPPPQHNSGDEKHQREQRKTEDCMAFDSKVQRKIFGKWATGVTVVTTDGPAGKGGLTANAVASLSLDPPLVLVAVAKNAHSYSEIKQNGCYAINILALAQEEASKRFATPGPKDFSGFSWKT